MNPNAVEVLSWDTDDYGTWTAYIGWNGLALFVLAETAGSAIVLDDADQGLLNTGVLGPTVDGWVDIGCDLLSLQFNRGASDDSGILTRYEAGTCELIFDNTDLHFEPDDPAWQINLGTTIVVLGRDRDGIEFVAADSSLNPWDFVFGLFKGTIEDWHTYGYETEAREARWLVVDDVARLQQVNGLEVSAVGAGDTTEERLNRCLAVADWSTQTGSFSGQTFSTVTFPLAGAANPTHQATTLAQPVWQMMLLAADAGQRSVFISGTGLVVATPVVPTIALQWERWQWGCEVSQIPIVGVDWEFTKRQIVNTVDAAKAGGSQITVADETSQLRHGIYRTGRNDLTLEDDVDVSTWAGTVVAWSAEPTPRITRLRVSPSLWNDDDLNVGYFEEHYELVDLAGPHAVALVVGNSGALTAGDTVLQGWLTAQFDTVTVFDDSAAEGSITAGAFDAIVIAPSITPATVGTKWLDFGNSVAVLDGGLWDEHELLNGNGTSSPQATGFSVNSPEASWLSLPAGTYSYTVTGGDVDDSWATETDVPAAAEQVTLATANPAQIGCWTFDTGDARADSSAAPARRAALGATEAILTDASVPYQTLFGDLMTWLVPSTFAQQLVSDPAVSNAWQALLEFSDWVGSSWVGEDTGLRHHISTTIPGTTRTLEDTVAFRGVDWRLDADVVEIEFVTSTISQFLDQFILDDSVQGILDAGHRVS